MKIEKVIMRDPSTGLDVETWQIWYDGSTETKPTGADVPAVSWAYCYKGTDKGKIFIYDGSAWEEQ